MNKTIGGFEIEIFDHKVEVSPYINIRFFVTDPVGLYGKNHFLLPKLLTAPS